MSGHNKWSQIRRQKGITDAKKSKVFSKHARLIAAESKKSNGATSPGLGQAIENAKKDNVSKDVIDRAIKKGTESGGETMEQIAYECYGPGGCAIIIEALTTNKNKAAQEIKHILSKNGFQLASIGSASWAFKKEGGTLIPQTTVDLEDADLELLSKLVDELEENEEVEEVFTNVE
ncbi:MAG: YebC/PmpR family DNA-binding transcriptional regulator [Candidatus Paceibacterota bacterium]